MKVKWRNLRDQFQREMKKVKKPRSGDPGSPSMSTYSGKWVYFKKLLFLKDTMMPKRTDSNFNNETPNSVETENKADDTMTDEDLSVIAVMPGSSQNQDVAIVEPHNETPEIVEPQTHRVVEPQTPEIEQPLLEDTSRTHSQNACVRGKKRKALKLTDFEKNLLDLENKKLSLLIDKGSQKETDIDDDVHFVQSLVPFLRRFNPLRKLVIRSQIQNLIIQELSNETPTTSGGTSSTEYSTDISNYLYNM